jgi:hypothetical protein
MRLVLRLVGVLSFSGCLSAAAASGGTVLVEAESFEQLGGWVIDTQAIEQMGSPYVMAHGLGQPVADARMTVALPAAGTYRIWVRTRDWAAPWNAPQAPGRFQVLVDGTPLTPTFGAVGASWHWQDGGALEISGREVQLALRDLTGFNGRCDAILLTTDLDGSPPNADPELQSWRRRLLGIPEVAPDAGSFELVVVGGGLAGCCTAISAARRGVRVALIQNRPVLGGNNSSEVRVGLSGQIHQQPYPRLGDLVDEIGPIGYWNYHDAQRHPDLPRSREVLDAVRANPSRTIHNAGPAANYDDDKKRRAVLAEENIQLFLNTHAYAVQHDGAGRRIAAVLARSTTDLRELRFPGRWFADCTGDGTLGFLAGAAYRLGRESRAETGESLAPEQADALTMGTSVQWDSVLEDQPSSFPDCPWAVPFDERTYQQLTRGDWDWEAGIGRDQITEIEQIRDLGLRAVFGNWAYLKNGSPVKDRFARRRLAWVAYVGGKRESRRLIGDVVLQQQDLVERKTYPDACVTVTWPIDLHYPHPENARFFPGQEFRSIAKSVRIQPYPIPYRCLYSADVPNLFMAGRNISVTHVALGAVRVQRTTGMMGEVVGLAAGLCKQHATDPRGVYEQHLEELQALMRNGVGRKQE